LLDLVEVRAIGLWIQLKPNQDAFDYGDLETIPFEHLLPNQFALRREGFFGANCFRARLMDPLDFLLFLRS
jgi:hypothetical protein